MPGAARRARGARGLAVGARRAGGCGSSCRSAARSAALVDLANRNAALAYQTRVQPGDGAAQYDALETLRHVLALPALPRRIECFDISTIQGSETVASMVVCEDGRMQPRRVPEVPDPRRPGSADWRPAWRTVAGPRRRPARAAARILDDFAAMHEVVRRRYRKVLEQGGPFPDLIVIDGGKGQLSAAYAALEELGLANLVAVGLAKKEELLFTRDATSRSRLPAGSPALLLVQRIRDEAHRFAVTFHRQARTHARPAVGARRRAGVGPRRRKTLLTRFGSLAGVRRATREELSGGGRRESGRCRPCVFRDAGA